MKYQNCTTHGKMDKDDARRNVMSRVLFLKLAIQTSDIQRINIHKQKIN